MVYISVITGKKDAGNIDILVNEEYRQKKNSTIEKEIRRKIEHRLGILLLSFLFSQNPLYYFSNHGKLEPTTKKMIDNPSST